MYIAVLILVFGIFLIARLQLGIIVTTQFSLNTSTRVVSSTILVLNTFSQCIVRENVVEIQIKLHGSRGLHKTFDLNILNEPRSMAFA